MMKFQALALLLAVTGSQSVQVGLLQNITKAEKQLAAPKLVPEECMKMMNNLQKPEGNQAAMKCEQDEKYSEKAVRALQDGDEKSATSFVVQLFQKCAKFSKACATKAAAPLVMELRFSGAAVTNACKEEVTKAQADDKRINATAECDDKAKFSEKTMTALNEDNLKSAVEATEQSLSKCMKISEACASQLAPVFVNSFIMRVMMEQELQDVMATVLISQPVLVVEEPVPVVIVEETSQQDKQVPPGPPKGADPSFLSMALERVPPAPKAPARKRRVVREAVAPALVQERARRGPYVSKLLMHLAMHA